MADELPDAEYEPHFDRLGIHRRVLGHITDEDHVGRGPRNTADRLTEELGEDPFTPFDGSEDDVQEYLDDLEASGLVSKDADVYTVTEAGQYELTH
jgi:ribosomal protein S19E (S16A)